MRDIEITKLLLAAVDRKGLGPDADRLARSLVSVFVPVVRRILDEKKQKGDSN